MYKFICPTCGSSELVFTCWVKCDSKVIVYDDGFIEYQQKDIDDNDVLGAEYRFICGTCRQPLKVHGEFITTESELADYLNLSAQQFEEIEANYQSQMEQEVHYEEQGQEERENLFAEFFD